MTKDELIKEFLKHIVTLSLSERRSFIYWLRKSKQIARRVYGCDEGECCVLGAFAKAKGIKTLDACYAINIQSGPTDILTEHFKVPRLVGSEYGCQWPAMTHLNDNHGVTFPEFIALIQSTFPRRHYFVCALREDGVFGYGNCGADYSYLWHPGTGNLAYCHNLDGTDTALDHHTDFSLEECQRIYKEVTQSEAHAFHKRCQRKHK